jgi:hypothetical protein
MTERLWSDHRVFGNTIPGDHCLDCGAKCHVIVGSPGFDDGIGWPGPCDWSTQRTKSDRPAAVEAPPINDTVCMKPSCNGRPCSTKEKVCWWCGAPLSPEADSHVRGSE